ncbi:spermidine synthase, partial [Streptomyces sp. SID7958]|nr:spermidine synthase [Streptomyces sp. SID7958]
DTVRRLLDDGYRHFVELSPHPAITESSKLYSQEFYGLARRVLAPGGRLVAHTGPVAGRPRVLWTVESTLRAAGLGTAPYRVTGR